MGLLRLVSLVSFVTPGVVAVACVESGAVPPVTPRDAQGRDLPPGCEAWNGQPVETACIPRAAPEGVPLVLEAVAACGACGAQAEVCTVTRDGRTLTLSLDGRNCTPPQGTACTSSCTHRKLACNLPALEAGRYVLRWNDASGRVDSLDVLPDRALRFRCELGS